MMIFLLAVRNFDWLGDDVFQQGTSKGKSQNILKYEYSYWLMDSYILLENLSV